MSIRYLAPDQSTPKNGKYTLKKDAKEDIADSLYNLKS